MNDLSRKFAAAYFTMVTRLRDRQEGATAAEYALLVALISVVIIGTVTALGGQIDQAFTKVSNAISTANGN